MDLAPDDAWRRIVPPTPHDVVKGGKAFQDLVGSYLCSVGLVVLNRRHLADLQPVNSAGLADFMIHVADEIFSTNYYSESPGTAHVAKRYRLYRSKLIDSMSGRAIWIIKNHNPAKIEGRQRGGRHGASQGVRKGPAPKLYPFMVESFMHLDPGERKRAFMAEHRCSDSTFYSLQRRYLHRLERSDADVLDQVELHSLLPVQDS